MRIEDIPKAQIAILAQILYRPPSEPRPNYASRVYCLEPQLDRPYLRPDFLHRLIQRPQSYYTTLCDLHKILNAKVVHQIFMLLANEVGLRLNNFVVAGRDKLGHETWDLSILNLRSLHGAWLQPEVFWDTFGHTLDVTKSIFTDEDYMTKWIKESETCEACILTRIGSDINTVLDLQMLIKSRTHTRSVRRFKPPRLSGVIEGWLDAWKHSFGANEWRAKLEWNRLRGDRLKGVRRQLAKEKRQARLARDSQAEGSKRHRKPQVTEPATEHVRQRTDKDLASMKSKWSPSHASEETLKHSSSPGPPKQESWPTSTNSSEDEDDPEIRHTLYAAENEIIDCYAALISTPFLPGMGTEEHQKRASTLSLYQKAMMTSDNDSSWLVAANETNDQRLGRSQSTRHRRPSNYSESVYSQVSGSFQAATKLLPTRQHESSSSLRRSMSMQDKRTSDRSWITASIAPSITPSQISPPGNHGRKSKKPDHRFNTISEEPAATHRQSSRGSSRYAETPVSPIRDSDRNRYHRHNHNTNSSPQLLNTPDSPVSPLSPTDPKPSASKSKPKSQRHEPKKPKPPNPTPESSRSNSRPRSRNGNQASAQPQPSTPKLNSRLSRPFSGPSVQVTSLLGSVRRLREPSPPSPSEPEHEQDREQSRDRGRARGRKTENERSSKRGSDGERNNGRDRNGVRDTVATNSTTWSRVYEGQRGRIDGSEGAFWDPYPT